MFVCTRTRACVCGCLRARVQGRVSPSVCPPDYAFKWRVLCQERADPSAVCVYVCVSVCECVRARACVCVCAFLSSSQSHPARLLRVINISLLEDLVSFFGAKGAADASFVFYRCALELTLLGFYAFFFPLSLP